MASDPVAEIDLVGVRFDGMGRSPGQAGAPQALRAAGLETALPTAELTSDVILPAPTSTRGPAGFINEPALMVMVDTVYSRVRHSLRTGRFPLLYGADCAVLLAAIPALRDTTGRAGGHGNTLVPSPWQARHSGGLAPSGSRRPSAGAAGATDPGAGGSGEAAVCRLPSSAGRGIRPTARRRSRDLRRLIWQPAQDPVAGRPRPMITSGETAAGAAQLRRQRIAARPHRTG
jgi:hypothetical protein